jgi:hypothetical protein
MSLDITDEAAVQKFGESIANDEWDASELYHLREKHRTAQ